MLKLQPQIIAHLYDHELVVWLLACRRRLSFAFCYAEELECRRQVLAQEYESIYRTELPGSGPEQKFSIQVEEWPYEKLCPLDRSCELNECTVLHRIVLVRITFHTSVMK